MSRTTLDHLVEAVSFAGLTPLASAGALVRYIPLSGIGRMSMRPPPLPLS